MQWLHNVHCRLCKLICGDIERQPPEMPSSIREASHNQANLSSQLQASAVRIRREADVLTELTKAMQAGS